MAIVALPAGVRIASASWTLDRPAQVHLSAYTGRRKVMADPWHARWSAEIELAPVVGEAHILAWRAFLAALRGQVNSFRLPAAEQEQSAASPLTNGPQVAGSIEIATRAWPPSATALKAGQMFTLSDQLCIVKVDAVSDTFGNAQIQFEPPLRTGAADGQALVVGRPTALVSLTSSSAGWSVGPGQLYGARFSVEEAIA
jgi:hypothetical protein